MKVYITQRYQVTTVLDVDLASCKDDDSIRCALALAYEKANWLATQALRAVPEVKEAYGTGEAAKFGLTLERPTPMAQESGDAD